jgi:N-acetylglucosaminyl-diphospho-decaprenol L-rhamnosyltransferase
LQQFYFLIVNYYSTSLVRELLGSIANNQSLGQNIHSFQVYIVNNSPDDTEIYELQDRFPNLKILSASQNLGFGGGCNLGLEEIYKLDAKALVWPINPDALLDADAIAYVSACFHQDPAIAMLGTRIRDRSNRFWFRTGHFNPWIGSITDDAGEIVSENPLQRDKPTTVPSRWITGCSFILNLAQFDRCPLFSSDYFLYYEDVDLCERYYQQGYRIAVTNSVLVTHAVSQITDRNREAKFRHNTFSKLYFLSQHAKPTALWLNLVYMPTKILFRLLSDRPAALGRWQGLVNFLHCWTKR